MTQAFILGGEGKEGLLLADLQSGTITPAKEPLARELAKAASLRTSGVTITKGVDIAIATSAETLATGSIHEGNN
ncbi:hypothetical protein [Agrobacterium bohemicum]|uniref:Uncharacterized protein n=1 Tax=Agrobacterium bohemicum TaxID=2052828 RepID=A0A135P6G2_9HYPH|nr:hypothetical protein [Agrobacterium bohemicum]KXG87024.1 hypothetical protein ATO67_21810 [Agrobacterium bohemicum]